MLKETNKDSLGLFSTVEDFNSFLSRTIYDAQENGKIFSIALIELDHFKRSSDRFGHDFKDEVLKYAASTLRMTFSECPCQFFHSRENELAVFLPDKVPKETFQLVRRFNYNMLSRPFLYKNKLFRITFSCGIAGFPDDGNKPEELIREAGEAKYLSKRDGHNLAVLAGRIKFIKLRNYALMAASIYVILFSLNALYQYSLKRIVHRALYRINQIKDIRITTKPRSLPGSLDVITLKNGGVFEGRVLQETDKQVILSFGLDKGESSVVFNKSEIENIKYGLTAPSK